MAFTWKFKKPVSSATLTANGYSLPSGTTDPTEDILKAQLLEIRSYIDSVDSLVRCSSNYLTVYSDRYSITCGSHNSSYGTCGTHYTSKNSSISCSTTYSTRYTSKYGTRKNESCSQVNYSKTDICDTVGPLDFSVNFIATCSNVRRAYYNSRQAPYTEGICDVHDSSNHNSYESSFDGTDYRQDYNDDDSDY